MLGAPSRLCKAGDQALLSVLPVRHQSLRLAALCRRVLVIDEVHSYAPYEAREVEALLAFHARHGGSAIVLSATLTRAQRRRLASVYAGVGVDAVGTMPIRWRPESPAAGLSAPPVCSPPTRG